MSRRAVWLAWSLCALCVALAAGSFVLALLNGRSPREILIDEGIVAVATLAVAFSVVGALIASHRPANPIGWIFCAAAVFQGVSIYGYEYATYALLTRPGSLPLGAEAAWVAQWIWAPGLGLILVFLPLLFPDGRPPSRRWRPVVWLGVLSIGLNFVSAVVFLWPHRGPRWWDPKALRKKAPPTRCSWSSSSEPSRGCSWPGSAPWSPWSSASAGRGGVERQQIKWFAYAAVVYAALIPLDLLGLDEPLGDIVWSSLNNAATLGVYVAVGIAILRYRLYQIDIIINRTLVYVSLTVMLVLSYLGGVVVLQTLFRALTEQGSQLAIVASTLAIAAIFNPLRRRVQAFVDRLFYRRKYDAAKTLEALATRLRDETDLETLKRDLVGVVSETVLPAHARLWLREAKEERWGEMREN